MFLVVQGGLSSSAERNKMFPSVRRNGQHVCKIFAHVFIKWYSPIFARIKRNSVLQKQILTQIFFFFAFSFFFFSNHSFVGVVYSSAYS